MLRGSDLEALPDDPDELTNVLRAMAGPSAGLSGSQFLVDGYSTGSVPSKESIREIRLNENPFSAEYDKLGFGRVEIITKAGTDKLRGDVFLNFNDESLNARNPFAANRAPFQSKYFGGNLSGPIVAGKASYFLNFEQRNVTDNAVVNAVVLGDDFDVEQFNRAVVTPQTRTSFGSRLDYQLNRQHSLISRYSFLRTASGNAGIGDFSLPSRAFDATTRQHVFNVTETAVLNARTVNETRFQFVSARRRQEAGSSAPAVRVLDAFVGGGSDVGIAHNDEKRWELQNNTTWALPKHILRAGGRLRGTHISDFSPQNFNSTYTFAGGSGPLLDADDRVVINPETGLPVQVGLTSIERYRRTLLFQGLGLNPRRDKGARGRGGAILCRHGRPFGEHQADRHGRLRAGRLAGAPRPDARPRPALRSAEQHP